MHTTVSVIYDHYQAFKILKFSETPVNLSDYMEHTASIPKDGAPHFALRFSSPFTEDEENHKLQMKNPITPKHNFHSIMTCN
jgi:hypothetical protein